MPYRMYYQHIAQAFKFSRSTPSCFLLMSWSKPAVMHGQLWHARCLHTHNIMKKNVITTYRQQETGFVKSFFKRFGWLDYSRTRLKVSGYLLYENVADKIPYLNFFQEFQMEDTFYSWFLVTELHIWMLMVRMMAEGKEGRFTRNNMLEAMWQDVGTRAKKLEPGSAYVIRQNLKELSEQFQAAIVGYDEGLLCDDKILAGAVWRRFFQQKCNDPEFIECVVHYIRKQVHILDEMDRDEILLAPNITWTELPRKFVT